MSHQKSKAMSLLIHDYAPRWYMYSIQSSRYWSVCLSDCRSIRLSARHISESNSVTKIHAGCIHRCNWSLLLLRKQTFSDLIGRRFLKYRWRLSLSQQWPGNAWLALIWVPLILFVQPTWINVLYFMHLRCIYAPVLCLKGGFGGSNHKNTVGKYEIFWKCKAWKYSVLIFGGTVSCQFTAARLQFLIITWITLNLR